MLLLEGEWQLSIKSEAKSSPVVETILASGFKPEMVFMIDRNRGVLPSPASPSIIKGLNLGLNSVATFTHTLNE